MSSSVEGRISVAADAMPAFLPPSMPVLLPPSSRYRVIGPLSAGQSRQLYLAEEIESARRANLEVFDSQGNAEVETRLQQQAHLAARVCRELPGTAAVCEWGRLADG